MRRSSFNLCMKMLKKVVVCPDCKGQVSVGNLLIRCEPCDLHLLRINLPVMHKASSSYGKRVSDTRSVCNVETNNLVAHWKDVTCDKCLEKAR